MQIIGLQEVMSPYAQIQPQAPEAEKAVLGALMIDKDAYVVVCEILKPKSARNLRARKQLAPASLRALTVLINKPKTKAI